MKLPIVCLLIASSVLAQNEIEVTASPIRKEIGPAGSQSVRYLESAPWLTVQSQGGRAAQLDLSIQGSSFSGAGLSLNGISLHSAQTEHFNADLPLPSGALGTPDTSAGIKQLTKHAGHLFGTVDLCTRSTFQGEIEIGAGTEDTLFTHLTLPVVTRDAVTSALFFSHEETDALSFDDNYLKHTLGGAVMNADLGDLTASLAIGFSTKDFGARGFYGVTPDWNAKEVLDDQLVIGSLAHEDDISPWRLAAAWRRTEDEYTLLWTLPGTYLNQHSTDFTAVNADGSCQLAKGLDLLWRASGSSDRIESELLGNHGRESASILAMPVFSTAQCTFAGGVNQLLYSDDDNHLLPAASVTCSPKEDVQIFASYTETRRLPSYTELNYESPGSLGNQGLAPEHAVNWESGISLKSNHADFRLVAFRHETRNSIDWIKTSADETRWNAANLDDVTNTGAQLDFTGRTAALEIYLSYVYLQRDFTEEFYAGRYVVNYPEHCIVANIAAKPASSVTIFLNHEFRLQHEAAFRDSLDNSQVMADAGLSVSPAFMDSVSIDFACENLWDDAFEIFPGQPPASRRYSISVQWYWN